MASTSSTFAPFTSSSHFTGRKVFVKDMPTRFHFRQLRKSAVCSTISIAERTVSYIVNPHSPLYEILAVHTGATCQEIKAAYRGLARVLHPDVSANAGPNNFIRVHEAYSTLLDPEKWADYDRSLLFRQRQSFSVSIEPMTGSMSFGFFGYTGQTWETDQCW